MVTMQSAKSTRENIEQATWNNNRRQLEAVKGRHNSWPGAAGLAFVFLEPLSRSQQSKQPLFVANADIKFASLIPVNLPAIVGAARTFASVADIKFQRGAIVLDAADPLVKVDWGCRPAATVRVSGVDLPAGIGATQDCLNSEEFPQLVATFNRLQTAIIAYARKCRRVWADPDADVRVRYGQDWNAKAAPPNAFDVMPLPYVSTKLTVTELLEICTLNYSTSRELRGIPVPVVDQQPCWDLQVEFVHAVSHGLPIYAPVSGTYVGKIEPPAGVGWSSSIRNRVQYHCIINEQHEEFIFETLKSVVLHCNPGTKVRRGDELGFCVGRMTDSWQSLDDPQAQYALLEHSVFGRQACYFHLHTWLQRQFVYVNGEWVLPYHLVSIAATHPKHYDDFELKCWNFGTNISCYNSTAAAWLLPPFAMYGGRVNYQLPWSVVLNLVPYDQRLKGWLPRH